MGVLRRVGDTLIVTIPKRVAGAIGWREGDEVQVQIARRDALRLSKGG
ncbi:MAG: AbrB/MazE/SpoVT family DNA-binding domain-containing protein [Thermoplasmata archaeon]